MDLQPIHAGMFLVPGAKGGKFPYSHSVLIDSETVCLVDAGCGMAALEQVVDLASPDLILCTHAHPDNVSGCWMFDDVPLHVPVIGSETFGRFDALAERFSEPGALAETWKKFFQGSIGFSSRLPTHTYDAGSSFDFGQVRLVAIHAPGHTEDHMCFFDPTSGVLLSADIDLSFFGPWYGDKESDIDAFKASIRRVRDLEPRVVVSAREGIIKEDIDARFSRYYDTIYLRHGAIAELVRRKERTIEDLVELSPIFRGHPYAPALIRYWERQMIEKHLELLILENRVIRTKKGYAARHPRKKTTRLQAAKGKLGSR